MKNFISCLILFTTASVCYGAGFVTKEGHVRTVNEEEGFVIVDLGRADHVNLDTVFLIEKGDEAFATLRVLEIRDVMTACSIAELNPGYKIEEGDPVKIRSIHPAAPGQAGR